MKIIIIGGGAIGMMQARSLAHQGCDVVLIEKGLCGKESSWAGGGIVSPLYPWRYNDAVTMLASWSQGYYGNLAESLEAESGIDPELCRHGLLVLAVEDQASALAWGQEHAYWLNSIDKEEIYRLEPNLSEGFREALYMPQVASIRNPRMTRALRYALEREPRVTIAEEQSLSEFITEGHIVRGVVTDREKYEADKIVIAAGAWSGNILSLLGLSVPVAPVKGQMVLFRPEVSPVKRIVLREGKYVIPRRDGRVIAGSTLEYCGFDKSTTDEAKEELTDVAIDMFPDLAQAVIETQWAGLRPGMEDGVPMIGAVSGYEGLYMNAGHFRNGLVLAPASVELMTSILLNLEKPFSASPFDPDLKIKPL